MLNNNQEQSVKPKLGVSGRIASYFQSAQITPLIALVALLPVSYTHLTLPTTPYV